MLSLRNLILICETEFFKNVLNNWGLLKGATLAYIRRLNYIDIFK